MTPQAKDADLLLWAVGLIRRAQDSEMHGNVRIEFKSGRIVSAKVEETVLPPRA
jgi:hypothetical protein